jgi:tripartite-type tricarboxylate transporter receptor subunit TctC
MLARIAALVVLALATATACAQTYPSKPIRVVVGYPPGGGNDLFARLVGAKLQQSFGQPVVVENKPGANGIIAAEFVVRSAPDGHTLLVGATGQISINPVLHAKLPYDTLRDLAPITAFGSFPLVVAVHPALPVNSVPALVAYANANPDNLKYGAGAAAFQFATELFKQMTGASMRHIPYKGSAQAINALLAGEVDVAIVDSPPLIQHVRSGRLRALAVTSSQRAPALPELPTVAETGVPGYEMVLWSGLFAPAATPRHVIARVQTEVARIVHSPDMRDQLATLGVEPLGSTPEALAATIEREIIKYGVVARVAGIKAE